MIRDPWKRLLSGMTILVSPVVALINRRRTRPVEHPLDSRLAFENAISEVSAQFMTVPIDRMDDELNRAILNLGPLIDVNAITLLEFEAENTVVALTNSNGGRNDTRVHLRIDDLAWYSKKLLNNEEVLIRDVDQLPEALHHLKDRLHSRGVNSSFSVPLKASAEIMGALAFGSIHKGTAVWRPAVVQQCRLVANIFSSALLRKRAAGALGAAAPFDRRVRELSGKLIRAQEEERLRIARELHDDICQQLAVLVIDLRRIRDIDCACTTCKERISSVCRKVDQLSKDVHDLSHSIYSTKLHHLGLVPALRELSNEFSQLYQPNIECRFHGLPARLDANTSLIMFRVAQEALTNMAKHSNARHGVVELSASESELMLRVSDDGVGFEVASVYGHNHLGLISMQERVQTAGGVLTIRSQPSAGTQIEARLPLRQVSSGWETASGSRSA